MGSYCGGGDRGSAFFPGGKITDANMPTRMQEYMLINLARKPVAKSDEGMI
jgi:hypothetical protein